MLLLAMELQVLGRKPDIRLTEPSPSSAGTHVFPLVPGFDELRTGSSNDRV